MQTNHYSNPIDSLIELCETGLSNGEWKISKFLLLNAKDELRSLRNKNKHLLYSNIAWANINGRGDIYNLTLHYNRFQNEDAILPLYCNKKEFQEKYGKLSK